MRNAAPRIMAIPVLLVWGDKDRTRPSEHDDDHKLKPGAHMETAGTSGQNLRLPCVAGNWLRKDEHRINPPAYRSQEEDL